MCKLKELRIRSNMTQQQAADAVGVSLRSYKSYENEPKKQDSLKYRYICQILENLNPLDETHGILKVENIRNICTNVFDSYDVSFCYLFGSYAKGKAAQESDVDLLIDTGVTGLKYYGLVEDLRTALHKKVDVLNIEQLNNNPVLLREILKDGIKIYG